MKGILTFKDKIVLAPLWALTLLPLKVLYPISDILYFITYYIIGYRKNVVFRNLVNSFPDKDAYEIERIAKNFYHHLCDYFLESIYLINISLEECNRRYTFSNLEVLERLKDEGKRVFYLTSHYGNWEWAINLDVKTPYHTIGIYKHIHNDTFDRLFQYLRSKFGCGTVLMNKTLKTIIELKRRNVLFALYSVADQRPGREDLNFWTIFLNQDTPVITGTEKLARKYDMPVVFMNVKRIKRGYYNATFELISDNPKQTKGHEIAEKYIRKVEQLIIKEPAYWLWSHKRWRYGAEEFKPKASK
ncbi:MAG: lysophospholipid acyltransferase family protein [Bacteroidales bacterium]|nr:lysophospholipid acyltransferase family protein [Bacteroidales bacterium]